MPHTPRDTDQDWRILAETEPHWSMISDDAYRQDVLDDAALARFMQTGEEDISHLFGLVQRHLVPDFQPQRALDVGCGVGRQLLPLARRVPQVVGVDVAPAMLALSARAAQQAGLSNVQLQQADDRLAQVEGQFGLVHCYLVLQHIEPSRGYALLQAMLERLAPGGVGSLQITYAKAIKFLPNEQHHARYYRRDGRRLIDVMPTGWQARPGTVSMYDYDLNQVMAMLQTVAGQPLLALPTSDDSHLGTHFIFQRAR